MADDVNTATGAIANILGINDPMMAERAMRELAQIRAAQLAKTPMPGRFDLKHAQKIHAHLFRDFLPKKALGAIRAHELIERGAGMHVHHQHIAVEYEKVHAALQANTRLNPQATKAVAARELAQHWAQLHAISPFRRGNLAVSKIMVERIAILAGHPLELDAKKLDQARLLLLSRQTAKLAQVLEQSMTPALDKGAGKAPSLEKHLGLGREAELVAAKYAYVSGGTAAARAKLAASIEAVQQSRGPAPKTMEEAKAAFERLQPPKDLDLSREHALAPDPIGEAMRRTQELRKNMEISKGQKPY